MDPQLAFWIEKGGAFGVIAILVYFYRRDWKTLTEYWQQQNSLLMQIVQSNTQEFARTHESVHQMHQENRAALEAIRNRLHELSDPLNVMAAGFAAFMRRRESDRANETV